MINFKGSKNIVLERKKNLQWIVWFNCEEFLRGFSGVNFRKCFILNLNLNVLIVWEGKEAVGGGRGWE